MRKIFFLLGMSVLLLSACLSFSEKDKEKLEENTEQYIPDDSAILYRTYLPFKKSVSRGLISNNIYTKYDRKESEEGLLRLSAQNFDPKIYYFQEGQYINEDTVKTWLSRRSVNPEGLNPPITDEIVQQAPIYLAHIVEQNYLVLDDQKKGQLGGISIGLVMNSVYYTKEGSAVKISDEEIENKGREIAGKVVQRLRKMDGLSDVPIVVGLFKQLKRESISPGTYFASAIAEKEDSELSKWKNIKEQYLILPAWTEENSYSDVNTKFTNFKHDIDKYFPNDVNIIGTLHDIEDKGQSIKIEIPIQFYGTSEIIGFTQYITTRIIYYFPNIHVEVNVKSMNGPVALIIKKPKDEPYVHIYGH
ncbi:CamS family sex pheromone protein [Sporosarcina sp. Te-1]|uniref:CamS family sex pheromone protein n=1 Tax=Sporosarcina sp. Te-1 TaxID=2818390 RepID=UPI001FB0A28A|nr:CamS family sex pheromone protein [Sporosarcina sp. Te-1]